MSPALAGRFLTTAPPGKSPPGSFFIIYFEIISVYRRVARREQSVLLSLHPDFPVINICHICSTHSFCISIPIFIRLLPDLLRGSRGHACVAPSQGRYFIQPPYNPPNEKNQHRCNTWSSTNMPLRFPAVCIVSFLVHSLPGTMLCIRDRHHILQDDPPLGPIPCFLTTRLGSHVVGGNTVESIIGSSQHLPPGGT